MLAFSVREALRQAAAAFGPPGTSVELASPATPEQVYWALDRARSRWLRSERSERLETMREVTAP
jgi:xanthine dehydrogenase large subunit